MRDLMRVYILPHGHLENDSAWNFSVPNPATLDNRNPDRVWLYAPSFSVLISHRTAGWILYDTGSHPLAMRGRWPDELRQNFPVFMEQEDSLGARLRQLGLVPDDISTVIVSHLHMDHAGNLELFRDKQCGSKVMVHVRELESALLATHVQSDKRFSGAYVREDFDIEGIGFYPVCGDFELAKGIEVVSFEGHTAGILGLIIHLKNSGTLIFPSDAVYTRRNFGPPSIAPGILYDSLGFYRTVDKLRKLQWRYDATIIFPHDKEQFDTLKTSPEFYD